MMKLTADTPNRIRLVGLQRGAGQKTDKEGVVKFRQGPDPANVALRLRAFADPGSG
jgi:hypothetical protein